MHALHQIHGPQQYSTMLNNLSTTQNNPLKDKKKTNATQSVSESMQSLSGSVSRAIIATKSGDLLSPHHRHASSCPKRHLSLKHSFARSVPSDSVSNKEEQLCQSRLQSAGSCGHGSSGALLWRH